MPTLNWIGKDAVVNHHREVPYHLLRCDSKLSVGEAGSGNLLVQGDNLLALKALLPYYAGQVKCIYIDTPYNTGNENWVYNDNVNSPEMQKWLGKVVGKEAEDLSRHDKWLCMMYPRLALLPEVDYWVRNLERDRFAFWLQTPTDKFYPDFVANLKDSRFLVVEYKGEDRWSNEDSQEKRVVGELWAERSNGHCLFIMPKGKDFSAIEAALR